MAIIEGLRLRSGRGHPDLAPKDQAQAGPIMIRRTDIVMRATMRRFLSGKERIVNSQEGEERIASSE
jgi:hypothetical protein